MPSNRYFFEGELIERSTIQLVGKEQIHLSKIMRGRLGDTIELINGKKMLAKATIIHIDRHYTELHIDEVLHASYTSFFTLIIGQLKEHRIQTVLEKGTELGVHHFIFFKADKSDKGISLETKMDRYHAILIAAMKQCGRLDLPEIVYYPHLEAIDLSEGVILYGDPTGSDLFSSSLVKKPCSKITGVIGPEGGFSEKEILLLKTNKALPIRLGKDTLRAETAAIAMAVVFNFYPQK